MTALQVIDHPLVQHKLTILRDRETRPIVFREALSELASLLAYEAARDLPAEEREVHTPLEATRGRVIPGGRVALITILRAGNGLLDGFLRVIPNASVGHIGLRRDPETLQAVQYYTKLPGQLDRRDTLLLDPMLATGNSALAALDLLNAHDPRSLRLVTLVAAPEGVAAVASRYPGLPVITAALDDRIDDHGYIRPGLGDAGDRIYGTGGS